MLLILKTVKISEKLLEGMLEENMAMVILLMFDIIISSFRKNRFFQKEIDDDAI